VTADRDTIEAKGTIAVEIEVGIVAEIVAEIVDAAAADAGDGGAGAAEAAEGNGIIRAEAEICHRRSTPHRRASAIREATIIVGRPVIAARVHQHP
jgi:hypothetical protein